MFEKRWKDENYMYRCDLIDVAMYSVTIEMVNVQSGISDNYGFALRNSNTVQFKLLVLLLFPPRKLVRSST